MTATIPAPGEAPAHDAFPINGTDYIEFWCGNAKQSAHYYRAAWGHQLVGYRGPETGVRDRASGWTAPCRRWLFLPGSATSGASVARRC